MDETKVRSMNQNHHAPNSDHKHQVEDHAFIGDVMAYYFFDGWFGRSAGGQPAPMRLRMDWVLISSLIPLVN